MIYCVVSESFVGAYYMAVRTVEYRAGVIVRTRRTVERSITQRKVTAAAAPVERCGALVRDD